jgi:hypothetical protein
MGLLQQVHRRWATYEPLVQRIPASRLFSGRVPGGVELPYAAVGVEAAQQRRHTSGRDLRELTVCFDVWARQLDEAKDIEQQLRERFHDTQFALTVGRCLDMRWHQTQEDHLADGSWHLKTDYHAMIVLDHGE